MQQVEEASAMGLEELQGLLGTNVAWRFWSPEVIRAISGAEHCAAPGVPDGTATHLQRIEGWGPLLPLFHFHLGWPRVDLGLARWAAMDFHSMGDPTLSVICRLWGPGLPTFVLWSAETSGAPAPMALATQVLQKLRRSAAAADVGSPAGLHLDNHWSLEAYGHWSGPNDYAMDEPVTDYYQVRPAGKGRVELIAPLYRGWYRILTRVGDALPPLPNGRSWRVDLTIAPIGFVGTFRRSRESGRWFTGRHKVHRLGIR